MDRLSGVPGSPAATKKGRRRAKRVPEAKWASWPDKKLLDLRMDQLDLRIKGTSIEAHIRQLRKELKQRNIRFRPHFWISNDWFTPDGVPGTAIPFYMVHPRLAQLELAQMLDVEGGNDEWCMRILRHEAGHAIDNAYRLRRRKQRQRLFGKSSQPYPEFYEPRPYSRSFVLHLEPWYAQSHPDEDFAETFAVWLTPGSKWPERYANWPVLKKLEYMDSLMQEISSQPPIVTSRKRVEPLANLHKTLREHYREKRQRYGIDYPNVYDSDLRRLFSDAPEFKANVTAVRFVARVRRELMSTVARWTGEYRYIIKQVIDDITKRCRELNLRLIASEEQTKLDFTIFLAVQTMKYLHKGGHREWL